MTDADVIDLEPGQVYSVDLDLSDVRWHVESGGVVGEIGLFIRRQRFRITYRAPELSFIDHLEAKGRVWAGYLSSSAFTALWRID